MLICLQSDRLSPAWGVTFSTILAHMAQAKLYLSYGLIMDELIKPSNVSLATSSGLLPTPPCELLPVLLSQTIFTFVPDSCCRVLCLRHPLISSPLASLK